MNRYQLQNAIEKGDGYFLPSPTKPGGYPAEFERARKECLHHLQAQINNIQALSFEQFATHKKLPRDHSTGGGNKP